MDGDGLFVMAVSGVYGYHASKAGPKCTLVWVASCFAIPSSLTVRHLGTWDKIPDQLCRLEHDSESETVMPRMLTHADLHGESGNTDNYSLSPDHNNEQWDDDETYGDEQNDSKFEDPVDEYLAEYANLISSREKEEEELMNTQNAQLRSAGRGIHHDIVSEKENTNVEANMEPTKRVETHEERRRTFARRKSCSDASGRMSLSLSVAKDQTVDDLHVDKTPSPTSKPEKLSFKNITAMARRMSVPILDKSEDVDHGTKIYGETLIKKNRSTKQFREAFSEEHGDYIPHRAPKTLSKSLTTTEIEHVCDELKTDMPGSFKNVVTELKLRTSDYSDISLNKEVLSHDLDISGPILTKYSTTTTETEKENYNGKLESPVNYRNVVKELQDRKDDQIDHHNDSRYDHSDSWEGNSLNHSFADSYTSETSSTSNSLRRNKTHEMRPRSLNSPRANRSNDYFRDERFSKTSPVRDFDEHSSGRSTPRSFHDHHERSTQKMLTKHKSEEPVSDFMKKLNNLTAQTRLATRPSLGNIEGYDPSPSSSMMRSQSFMNVSSPALSPKHERSLLSSSLSSSASSSSDIPVLSYHNVVDPCYRCWKTVYSLDKMGPIRKVLYHKQCFRCVVCNTMLSLNNYRQNINDKSDVQVYCKKHVPSQESPHIGLEAKNLNVMMHHPKLDSVNSNIRGTKEDRRKSQNLYPLSVGRAISTPRLDLICSQNENTDTNSKPSLDKNGNVSLRELKMDETPKSVWTRSTFSAAKLDLNVPATGRKGSSLYRTVDSWNYL